MLKNWTFFVVNSIITLFKKLAIYVPIFLKNDLIVVVKKYYVNIIVVLYFFIIIYLLFNGNVIVANVFKMPQKNNTQNIDTKKTDACKHKLYSYIDKKRKYLNRIQPKGNYLVINTFSNTYYLYKNKKLANSGKCSTGSYILLEDNKNQKWIFKTPKGVFTILGKTTQPVWRKPDWAFIEEGLPVPAPYHHSRYEYGVLGDYALSLGNGYLIHGTLYQRSLGLPVTHGCIRLADKDLELVYYSLALGSKVYIY